jgi:hypothetical protein
MGAGATHPLRKAAFDPFEEDFKAILVSYRALRQDVEVVLNDPTGSDSEENLLTSVDSLLKRVYAYISWGLLQQADCEGDIDQTLELRGDVRRIDRSQRVREAIILGIAVGLAAGAAYAIQLALKEKLEGASVSFRDVLLIALAAFACGAVIGFKVPVACRINLVTPLDPIMARVLRDLLAQAKVALGSETAARDWVFAPNGDLNGITPAEAAEYKTQATGVGRLLEAEAVRRREEVRSERPMPVVIEGGSSAQSVHHSRG